MRPDCGSSKKTLISLEQVELVKLMKELEESVTAVKGQINALSVETLHLKYLMITRNKKETESAPSTSSTKPGLLDLAIKKEKNPVIEFDEEDDDE